MKVLAWTMIGCAIGLVACQSKTQNVNQAQFLTQKIYHAPAQIYNFDLGSSVLRGELDLKQSCSVTGTSLDIRDQMNQQVRVETINLNNNSEINVKADQPLKEVAPQILELYKQKYNATASSPQGYKAHVGDVAVSRLSNTAQQVDVAIFSQHNYAYILLLNSPLLQNKPENGKQQLQTLLKSLQIPGKSIAQAPNTLPISFDLSNTDRSAHEAWQKTYCS